MDAISQVSANAGLFKSNSRIYLYCCDFCYTFSFTVPSLPFFEINGIFAHFSFLDSPSERRMCILPLSRELLAKLDGHKSPVVADVQSSVVFEFLPDESEEKSMLLLWDFCIVEDLTEKASAEKPLLPPTETLPEAPLLDLEKVKKGLGCNCSSFPMSNGVLVNLGEDNDDDDWYGSENGSKLDLPWEEEDSEEEEEEEDSDDEGADITHTLAFKCIGAAHEKERQEFLKVAARKSRVKKLDARLRPEPTNEKDKNAIAIDIDHGTGYYHAGYIASELTKYIHPLLALNKIVDVSVEHIVLRVYFARMGHYPKLLITRKGAWDKFVIRRCYSTR